MRTCPSCGAAAKTGDKFCGQCGSPLGPELPGTGTGLPASPAAAHGPKKNALVIGALLVIVVIAVAAGYLFMKGAGGTAPATANQSGAAGSYVIVETEIPVTTIPATTVMTPTVTVTTEPTTMATMRVPLCPADRRLCANNCTDVRTDNGNCGSCGNVCPAGQSCSNGNCMLSCSSGKTACPEGCFNLNTDDDHCGTCGNNCPAGLICSNGQCAPPPTGITTTI